MNVLEQFSLTGKKALITGGAQGIGKACAIAMAQAGADIAVVDLNASVGEQTVVELKKLGVDALYIQCDVACE